MAHLFAKRLINKLYSRPYLIITNTVTGVISISIGDVLQQNLEHYWSNHSKQQQQQNSNENVQPFEWNRQRTRNMMIAGIYFSIFGHWWYSFLDRRFPTKIKSSVGKKLMAESAMGPLLVSSVFLIFGKINDQKFDVTLQWIRSNFGLICTAEWLVFIPIQWINFVFVPAAYRYLYVAIISIGYDAFLSYIFHRLC